MELSGLVVHLAVSFLMDIYRAFMDSDHSSMDLYNDTLFLCTLPFNWNYNQNVREGVCLILGTFCTPFSSWNQDQKV